MKGCRLNTYYQDSDSDTYGNLAVTTQTCSVTPPAGYVANSTDCNDGNAAVNPAADDASCNNVDDDCSGAADEDYVADSSCFLPGACAAGNVASSCVAGVETACATGAPTGTDTTCNGQDEDCDGAKDDGYVATATSCGVGACSGNTGLLTCVAGGTVDTCDPLAGATADTTCNGQDEDCDGANDDGYVATATSCGVGACSGNTGLLTCVAGGTVDTCDPLAGCNGGHDVQRSR